MRLGSGTLRQRVYQLHIVVAVSLDQQATNFRLGAYFHQPPGEVAGTVR
jgi:hypothetical protein